MCIQHQKTWQPHTPVLMYLLTVGERIQPEPVYNFMKNYSSVIVVEMCVHNTVKIYTGNRVTVSVRVCVCVFAWQSKASFLARRFGFGIGGH